MYDIADLYKADLVIPTAFEVATWQNTSVERQMRIACRQKFHETRLMQRILPDITNVLEVSDVAESHDDPAWDTEPSSPGALWNPETSDQSDGRTQGGVNYGPDDA